MHVAASDWCHDHVESALGLVCIIFINPLVGIALVVKSFLLCSWNYCYVYNLSHWLYIFILYILW
jgi:hypothetical protein